MEPTIIPFLNAQQQGMTSWAHGVNVLPEMAQATAQTMAQQLLKDQSQQVQAPEAGQDSTQVSDREHGKGQQQQAPEKKRKEAELVEEGADLLTATNPLIGNFLNLRT